ncbi:MAG: response regulator [Fimbriimonadaceae bacterium]|nr:response regulator [Fimbriimonadaceae bacterium]QYK56709.1 MAG: response regulator [Fimbriimonadaceae bacterium]
MVEPIRIVVIEDEPAITRLIRSGYGKGEVEVLDAVTGEDGIQLVAKTNPAVVLLDLGLPDIDGQEVCRRLREWTQVPIIVLSARGQESDKVRALDNGADDYMTKPFGSNELQARIRAALRHSSRARQADPEPVFESGPLQIDLQTRIVRLNGQEIRLTPIEYKLLATLVRHAGMVLTHKQLLEEVWGPAYVDELHYLRVYMGQLRHKLESDPARPKLIRTESGIGYRLLVES